MKERYLIVHSDVAEEGLARLEKGPTKTHDPAFAAKLAMWAEQNRIDFTAHLALIEEVRQRDGVVELADRDFPSRAGRHFDEGDTVVVYGLWRERCVAEAVEALQAKGVKVEFGPEDYSVLPPVTL